MSQAVDGFILDKSLNLSHATVAKYRYVLLRFAAFVNNRPVADVSTNDVRRWLLSLKDDDLSERTVHDYWAVLSTFWTWAEQELTVEHAIRGRIKAPSYTKRQIEPFTEAEVRQLVNAVSYSAPWKTRNGRTARSKRATGDRDKAILLVLIDSGLRVSELCNLRVKNYDASSGRLHVEKGKGRKPRYVDRSQGQESPVALQNRQRRREGHRPAVRYQHRPTASQRQRIRHGA
jgi:integrase/recombinase XerD